MKKILAFSLVEIMVALIVISCITAALAPAITKKLKNQSITIASSEGGAHFETNCSVFSDKCSLCDDTSCLLCKRTCEYNQFLNSAECKCKNCSDIFGPSCKQCSLNACSLCEKGNYISGGKCIKCEEGNKCDGINRISCEEGKFSLLGASECQGCIENCKTCNKTTGDCIACEDGFQKVGNECKSTDCGALAMKISISGKEYCMTKYNIGDGGLYIPSAAGVITHTAGSGVCRELNPDKDTKCCWIGKTASPNYCDDKNGGYSGCNRTLCTWGAAKAICENLTYNGFSDWRLPTYNEMVNLKAADYTIGLGSNGLMLCNNVNNTSGNYTACCNYNNCLNSINHGCNAAMLWIGESISDSACKMYEMYYANFKYREYPCRMAASFRCIRKL